MLRFQCPSCHELVSAPEHKRGCQGVCPRCRQPLTVPDPAPADPVSDIDRDLDEGEPEAFEPIPTMIADADDEIPIDIDLAAPSDIIALEHRARPPGSHGTLAAVGLGGIALVAAIAFIASGLWRKWLIIPLEEALVERRLPILIAPIAAILAMTGVAIIVATLLATLWLKSKLVAQLPDQLDWQPIDPDETPGFDHEGLAKMTEDIEALGFLRQVDSRITNKYEGSSTNFSRLFIHPLHQCFGELNQVIPEDGEPWPLRFMMLSLLKDGWSLTSGNREWNAIKTSWLWRQPRVLWTSHPQRAPAEVMDAHLDRRTTIVRELGVEVRSGLTPRVYFEHEQRSAQNRKRALRHRDAVMAIIDWIRVRNRPQPEWKGEYPQAARARSKKYFPHTPAVTVAVEPAAPAMPAEEPSNA